MSLFFKGVIVTRALLRIFTAMLLSYEKNKVMNPVVEGGGGQGKSCTNRVILPLPYLFKSLTQEMR